MLDSKMEASGDRPAQDALIDAIGADELADVFRNAGYRVTATEQNGAVQLMSASQGVGFAVRFGNAAPPQGEAAGVPIARYLDYTLGCVLQVQGDLPAQLVADWNRTKRFARLASHGPFLALEMDVIVAGGVTVRYLRSTIELWDRMVQEFLLHLRNRPAFAEQEVAARAGSDPQTDDAGQGRAEAAAQ
ncbi:bacterial sensory transduction regulator family protein [Burkholderia ubonensis]|uniref:YbjN domain-containing protein n=1 Tax=Burkholderia ubonensis TaxID=101571 RepID=UPI000751FC0A|nr:YbjN domain-containing protein [Burkholderia ubonensis]KVU63589.1 bacterial sensory transduction regulator family protein [Burkholderia ubonensis]KWH09605.1 bacterial sensory transduction regulator family protein [Burkholderia ubonensis]